MSDKKNPKFQSEVKELLDKTVVEEATAAVIKKWNNTLAELDDSSLKIWAEYESGKTIPELAKSHQLTVAQMTSWIDQIKRQMIQQLRTLCNVRQ
jgi:hypothetical protein